MPAPDVFAAVAFAARAHHGQFRKDGKTPYISHPVRVSLVVRNVFGFDDPEMLCAALLHDTLEDTTTDRDDIDEHFGPTVGKWVSALSKDSRMPYAEREAAFAAQFSATDWQVKVCKLADMYDNLADLNNFSPDGRRRNVVKMRMYLEALRPTVPEHVRPALTLVDERLAAWEARLTS